MNVLLVGPTYGIGDHITTTLIIARNLSATSRVHGLFFNTEGYHLMRQTPYFSSCILAKKTNCLDIARSFCLYDKVIISQKVYQDFMGVDVELLKNVTMHSDYEVNQYRPDRICQQYDVEDPNIDLDIKWFDEFYKDFQCTNKTILLNCKSIFSDRTYHRMEDVANLLASKFDVRLFDLSKDIRVNIHLINQARYVLTTDTSTYWIARALGKEPYVFLCPATYPNYSPEVALGTDNIVSNNHNDIDEIEPDEIVSGFLNRIRRIY